MLNLVNYLAFSLCANKTNLFLNFNRNLIYNFELKHFVIIASKTNVNLNDAILMTIVKETIKCMSILFISIVLICVFVLFFTLWAFCHPGF